METQSQKKLRYGWTTGACATGAVKAALLGLWQGDIPKALQITLPRGQTPVFQIAHQLTGDGWAEAGIIKDAGDDPDVTHGTLVIARVRARNSGVSFVAGDGVGTVTRPGLPITVGQAAINPVPRQMMQAVVAELAGELGQKADIEICISIPGGAEIAQKTWNPRLGIVGGLSILGTTGIVRPFSCSAWIASIHRGIDVARADGLDHVGACTGSTSERAVQNLYGLADHAMLDMGDFAGGVLKYLAKNPVQRLSIGGGIGKLAKLAQGAVDLHSARSQVDISALAEMVGNSDVAQAQTALHAYEIAGPELAGAVAQKARIVAAGYVEKAGCKVDITMVDRSGNIIARAG
ncbi:MAG: cobalt-precorrin-5B (C(1))-methyltransferase [Paracoccaceae bacterium]